MKNEFDKNPLSDAIEYRFEEFDGNFFKTRKIVSKNLLRETIEEVQSDAKKIRVTAFVPPWDLGPEYIIENQSALENAERIKHNLELQFARQIFKKNS